MLTGNQNGWRAEVAQPMGAVEMWAFADPSQKWNSLSLGSIPLNGRDYGMPNTHQAHIQWTSTELGSGVTFGRVTVDNPLDKKPVRDYTLMKNDDIL